MPRSQFLVALIMTLALAMITPAIPVAQAASCQFVLGFANLERTIPQEVGSCLDNEHFNPTSGDTVQHTTGPTGAGGLLAWRKADNWTAFTDGAHTWINGPAGLEYRLNGERFAWEANPDGLPVVADVHVGAGAGSPPAGPRLIVTDSTFGHTQGPLMFHLAGSGFVAGESVTLRGAYTPAFLLRSGNAQAPFSRRACDPVVLGPVTVTADASGNFTATLQGATNLLQGGALAITATGSDGSGVTLGGGGSLPVVPALPPGCRAGG